MTMKRVDANQKSIVAAFKALGWSVFVTSDVGKGGPDIVVGWGGMAFLFEIKDGEKPLSAQKLSPAEIVFHQKWLGHLEIVRSVPEVNAFVRRIEMGIANKKLISVSSLSYV